MNEPQSWLSTLSRATWTLLLAAVAVFVGWQVFSRVLPMLLMVGALLVIYRTALAGRRRDGW